MKKIQRKIIDLELNATKLSQKSIILDRRTITRNQTLTLNKLDEILGFKSGSVATIGLSIKRTEITNLVNTIFNDYSTQQVEQITRLVSTVYNNTRVGVSSEIGGMFDTTNDYQLKQLLQREYKGLNLSQRIYSNNKQIAERINNDISRLLYTDASPQQIKAQIAADFNITRAQAERLFRTETSRFYNEATHDAYRAAGIEQMEFLAEVDACEVCSSLDGKLYPIAAGTPVPVHPNCRCVILPVIKD